MAQAQGYGGRVDVRRWRKILEMPKLLAEGWDSSQDWPEWKRSKFMGLS